MGYELQACTKVYTPKSDTSETSEDNGEERKRAEKNFDEKRL